MISDWGGRLSSSSSAVGLCADSRKQRLHENTVRGSARWSTDHRLMLRVQTVLQELAALWQILTLSVIGRALTCVLSSAAALSCEGCSSCRDRPDSFCFTGEGPVTERNLHGVFGSRCSFSVFLGSYHFIKDGKFQMLETHALCLKHQHTPTLEMLSVCYCQRIHRGQNKSNNTFHFSKTNQYFEFHSEKHMGRNMGPHSNERWSRQFKSALISFVHRCQFEVVSWLDHWKEIGFHVCAVRHIWIFKTLSFANFSDSVVFWFGKESDGSSACSSGCCSQLSWKVLMFAHLHNDFGLWLPAGFLACLSWSY